MTIGDALSQERITETFPALLTMKEISMKKSDKSLLPLRGKISPPTILNCDNHAYEQPYHDKETANDTAKRERMFSVSSRSACSSKHDSSLSEVRSMTPPFTPPTNNTNGDQGFLVRRPSEHFLEVLGEHKSRETLPKVLSASCLPPLRNASQGEDAIKKNIKDLKGTNGVMNNNYDGAFSRPVAPDNNTLLLGPGGRRRMSTPIGVEKEHLRKTNSLPLIKTGFALTTGTDCINDSAFHKHTKSAFTSQENKIDECVDHIQNVKIDEYLDEELCDEDGVIDQNDDEETFEKFSMICHWLKDCEKAKIT